MRAKTSIIKIFSFISMMALSSISLASTCDCPGPCCPTTGFHESSLTDANANNDNTFKGLDKAAEYLVPYTNGKEMTKIIQQKANDKLAIEE